MEFLWNGIYCHDARVHHNQHYKGNTKGSNNDLPFIVKHDLGVSAFCVYKMARLTLQCNFPHSNWNHSPRAHCRTRIEWLDYPYDLIYSKIAPYSSNMMLEISPLAHPESQTPLATKAEIFSPEECGKVQKESWIFSHNKVFTAFYNCL